PVCSDSFPTRRSSDLSSFCISLEYAVSLIQPEAGYRITFQCLGYEVAVTLPGRTIKYLVRVCLQHFVVDGRKVETDIIVETVDVDRKSTRLNSSHVSI